MWRNAAGIEFFYPAQLICFQPEDVSKYATDFSLLPLSVRFNSNF